MKLHSDFFHHYCPGSLRFHYHSPRSWKNLENLDAKTQQNQLARGQRIHFQSRRSFQCNFDVSWRANIFHMRQYDCRVLLSVGFSPRQFYVLASKLLGLRLSKLLQSHVDRHSAVPSLWCHVRKCTAVVARRQSVKVIACLKIIGIEQLLSALRLPLDLQNARKA